MKRFFTAIASVCLAGLFFASAAMASGPPTFDLCMSEPVAVQDHLFSAPASIQCDAINSEFKVAIGILFDKRSFGAVDCTGPFSSANVPAISLMDPGRCSAS